MNAAQLGRFVASLVCVGAIGALPMACSKNDGEPAGARSAKSTATPTETSGPACAAHGAPKELCFICDAGLREPGRLWCKEHKRYEDRCWECHPDLREANRPFCDKHGLYDDECFLCHPELREKHPALNQEHTGATEVAGAGTASTSLLCKEHGVPESECGICHPDLLAEREPGEGMKVRLHSAESAGRAGVVVGTATDDTMQQGVECLAELTFNQNKLAQINPLAGGVVDRVLVDLGSKVRKQELLVRITSVAIGEAQSEYLRALAEDRLRIDTVERQRRLRAQRISAERDLQEAEAGHKAADAAVQQARQRLLVLGFDDERIRGLESAQGLAPPGVLEVRAPFAGVIVERTAVQGATVEVGKPLLTLADTTVLWAMINIPEVELSRVRVGQKAELIVDSLPSRVFPGTLTWLSDSVDSQTRMARGRVEVANTEGLLKAQMFARARLLTTSSGGVRVPRAAVQDVGGNMVVFVKAGEDLFEARRVRLGASRGDQVQIIEGLHSSDPVVITGAFALKSQFLISRLGAGCVD
jgi:cobalt-zinc-cadmium efflux system membrane fusion protein